MSRDADPIIPPSAPRIGNGAWASALVAHPRLLGPLGFIQERVGKYPELYARLKGGEPLFNRGIVHAVEGIAEEKIRELVSRALRHVERGITNLHQDTWVWLTDVALTYDLFFDHIPAGDRGRMIEWINPHLESYTDDEHAFHNSTPSKMLCYLRIAYATWGANPRAGEFRDHALRKLYEDRLLPVLRELGAGGGWTECGWYQRHSLWHCAEALELARRIEGYDGFAMAPRFWYQRMAYEMHQPYPRPRPDGTEEFSVEGDGSDRYWSGDEGPHLLRDLIAEYFRGSELSRYIANRRRWAQHPSSLASELLYRPDQDQEPLPLDTFPLAHLALEVGKVYARSDWSPEATWFRFECGDYWCGHQHFEVGNFEIFRHEQLATESGEYYDYLSNHDVNWLIRTIAHNCVLVCQPGEQWTHMRDGGRNEYANDGGQAKKWEWPVATLAEWQSRREQFTRGRIIAYQNTPQYLYVAGDCTKAYAPSKLSLWIRQILFVRPETFVVFDRVVNTKPEYQKTWLLHCRRQPEISGDTYAITNGNGRLTVRRLLPEQVYVHTVEGYIYGGQSFPPRSDRLADTANRWRLEEQPTAARTEDLFLHLMTTGQPVPATLVRKDGAVGVRAGDLEVVFEGRTGGRLSVASGSYRLLPEVQKGPYE